MKSIIAGLACCFLFAAPAVAQTVSLHPGETVTLRLDDNGKAVVESRVPAQPMSDYEVYLLRRAQMQAIPPGATSVPATEVYQNETPVEPAKPVSQRVQLTFRQVPGLQGGSKDQTALTLVNGYASSFRYRAVMRAAARSAPTDVCEIRPEQAGVEHWPFVIDQLDLSDLRLEQWHGGEIRCE